MSAHTPNTKALTSLVAETVLQYAFRILLHLMPTDLVPRWCQAIPRARHPFQRTPGTTVRQPLLRNMLDECSISFVISITTEIAGTGKLDFTQYSQCVGSAKHGNARSTCDIGGGTSMSAGRRFPGSASTAPTCGQGDMKGVRSQPGF